MTFFLSYTRVRHAQVLNITSFSHDFGGLRGRYDMLLPFTVKLYTNRIGINQLPHIVVLQSPCITRHTNDDKRMREGPELMRFLASLVTL